MAGRQPRRQGLLLALTKIDAVPPERLDAVRAEIAALLAPTGLAGDFGASCAHAQRFIERQTQQSKSISVPLMKVALASPCLANNILH